MLECVHLLTGAISFPVNVHFRKVVGKKIHATIQRGNMEYDQYTVPDTVAVEPAFVAFF